MAEPADLLKCMATQYNYGHEYVKSILSVDGHFQQYMGHGCMFRWRVGGFSRQIVYFLFSRKMEQAMGSCASNSEDCIASVKRREDIVLRQRLRKLLRQERALTLRAFLQHQLWRTSRGKPYRGLTESLPLPMQAHRNRKLHQLRTNSSKHRVYACNYCGMCLEAKGESTESGRRGNRSRLFRPAVSPYGDPRQSEISLLSSHSRSVLSRESRITTSELQEDGTLLQECLCISDGSSSCCRTRSVQQHSFNNADKQEGGQGTSSHLSRKKGERCPVGFLQPACGRLSSSVTSGHETREVYSNCIGTEETSSGNVNTTETAKKPSCTGVRVNESLYSNRDYQQRSTSTYRETRKEDEGQVQTLADLPSAECISSSMEGWPECAVSMLGPDVFNILKEEPHLVLTTSKHSGMSLFHHMLRHPSKDDEQVMHLFKCIYEDKPLQERVQLPAVTDLKCANGQTLAFYAAAYGHAKCLRWILEQAGGIEKQTQYLEIRDHHGDTPMHHAVKGGHVGVIELLLERVPSMLNQQRCNGQTPLFDALERPAIVRLLLRRGADYSWKCSRGLTALDVATEELRWKRRCSTRSSRALPKRLAVTVHLLRKAAEAGARKNLN